MYEILFQKIEEKVQLTDAEKDLVRSCFIPKKLRKRQYLQQEGDVARYTAFVEKGFLRAYTITDKGSEQNFHFAFEGWWINDQYSFITGEPSVYTIDALEDCELLLLTKPAEDDMLEKVPKMERYFRLLLQNHTIAMHSRLISAYSKTAEARYSELVNSCPTIAQRVPQHMMASFLGITPETLSRIRKQLTQKEA
jgi:CRP-like cAMP-binding protein